MTHMHRLGDVARRKAQEEALVDDEPADLRMVGGRHFDRSPGTLCRCDPLDPLDPRVLQDPPDPRVREGHTLMKTTVAVTGPHRPYTCRNGLLALCPTNVGSVGSRYCYQELC